MLDEMVRRSPQIKLCRQHEEDNGRAISGDLSFAVQARNPQIYFNRKNAPDISRWHHIKIGFDKEYVALRALPFHTN